MSDLDTAIEALVTMGVSEYEAKVLIAIHENGTSTARELHEISGIPRSQVYPTADSLAERGLIEPQDTDPRTFTPIALQETRDIFRASYEHDESTAFEFLESVRSANPTEPPAGNDIAQLVTEDRIYARSKAFVDHATSRLTYIGREDSLTHRLLQEIQDQDVSDTTVSIISPTDHSRNATSFPMGISTIRDADTPTEFARYLGVDGNHFLLSIDKTVSPSETTGEIAFSAEDSVYTSLIGGVIESWAKRNRVNESGG